MGGGEPLENCFYAVPKLTSDRSLRVSCKQSLTPCLKTFTLLN